MTGLATLSASKLRALYDKRQAACSVNCTALINASRGTERPTEIRAKFLAGDTNTLTLEYIATTDALLPVIAEMDYRRRYHGSLKPVRRAA